MRRAPLAVRIQIFLVICESVLVGVVVECFKLGHDSKVIDLIFTAAKARLAKIRLEDIDAKGSG
jgi:hypothetical protein